MVFLVYTKYTWANIRRERTIPPKKKEYKKKKPSTHNYVWISYSRAGFLSKLKKKKITELKKKRNEEEEEEPGAN